MVKIKAIFWHALKMQRNEGKDLIDLLKDTHILFSVRGCLMNGFPVKTRKAAVTAVAEISIIDKRPGSDTLPYRLWSESRYWLL